MLLAVEDELNEYGQFMRFDTLTVVPFDLRLIDKKYLDKKTINLINEYHKNVYHALAPYLNADELIYLGKITQEI